jgi:hypothetical protein
MYQFPYSASSQLFCCSLLDNPPGIKDMFFSRQNATRHKSYAKDAANNR